MSGPGIYTSNQLAVNQVLYYLANCMKVFKLLADAQQLMVASGAIQSSGSMALISIMDPAISLGVAYLVYTLYVDPQRRADLLHMYESLPQLALQCCGNVSQDGTGLLSLENLGLMEGESSIIHSHRCVTRTASHKNCHSKVSTRLSSKMRINMYKLLLSIGTLSADCPSF